MIKNFLLVVALLPFAFSCSLFDGEEEPEGLKTPEQIFILNDSLVSISQDIELGANDPSFEFNNVSNIQVTDNYIYVFDQYYPGKIYQLSKNGEVISEKDTVDAFYAFNNFIYVINNSKSTIKKYDEDFTFISSDYNSNTRLDASWFATGNNLTCLYNNGVDETLEIINFNNQQSTTIGSKGAGELQFNSTLTYLTFYDNLFYAADKNNDRIQVLNVDGTFNTEMPIDKSSMINIANTPNIISVNSQYYFMGNSNNVGDKIQMIRRVDNKYLGFIELNKISKKCFVATEEKLYVVSDYPTNNLIIIDL